MNSKHVFKKVNQDINRIFDQAGHPNKVAIVAIDYAKDTHTTLICDAQGRSFKEPFEVKNNPEGLRYLRNQIAFSCKRFAINPSHVIVGGEDCGSFTLNFVQAISQHGFLTIGVHAQDAQKQRENFQASTDKLDLLGIAKMLMDQRGTTRSNPIGYEDRLRKVTRHRDAHVRSKTALRNRIHSLVDELFPGFLDERKSGISPFSKSSIWLMKDRFSPAHTRRRNSKVLVRELDKNGMKNPFEAMQKLMKLAREVIEAPNEFVGVLQSSLTNEIKVYEGLVDCIEQIDREVALLLALTPGAMLTTMKGTGITLAAGVTAELGPLGYQPSVRRLTSYAGIVPRVKQTGGLENEARHRSVAPRCNRILKNNIVQLGNHLGLHGPNELMEDHRRRTANGQHADFGMAQRYLTIGTHLMRHNEAYIPQALRDRADPEELRAYYLKQWPIWRKKWLVSGALEVAFAPENPLGIWRECIEAIYDIKLPL